jgi:hypothetical protein
LSLVNLQFQTKIFGRFQNPGEMPHSEQRPGQNGDRRPYWPVHPSHQNRGQAPGQQRQTRDLTHGQDARGQRRYFSSRPPIEGPGQADPNEVLENVLGEVFKIIDSWAFIFCKIVNKSGDWDYITAKYYPMDQRNFGVIISLFYLLFCHNFYV